MNHFKKIYYNTIEKFILFLRKKRIEGGIKTAPKNFWIRLARHIDQFSRKFLFKNRYHGPVLEKKQIAFFLCIWGDDFINIFCNYCLPSLLQKGNLPRLLEEDINFSITIYTKSQDSFEKKAKEYQSYVNLKKIVKIDFCEIKTFLSSDETTSGICSDAIFYHASNTIKYNKIFFFSFLTRFMETHQFLI